MRSALLVGVVAVVVAHASSARPCGALFRTETDQNLALDAQRALIILRESTIAMHLQLHAATGGADFAWIVPVPGVPTLSLGDPSLFEALVDMTTPHVEITTGGGGGGGGLCAGDAKGGLDNARGDGVQHFGGGTLGDYTYDIIAGSSAATIEAWLGDNGYTLGDGFADAVAPYVGRASFVAVRLSPGTDVVDPDPLVVTFPRPFESGITYPLGMSRLSTVESAPVVLWVLADKRYRIANFGSAELQLVADVMREQVDRGDGASYADAIATLTAEAGGRLAITEYAQDLAVEGTWVHPDLTSLIDDDAHYLTRLYMDVPKASIEDLVVTFATNAPEVEPNATAQGPERVPATAALIVLAVGLVARRRRA